MRITALAILFTAAAHAQTPEVAFTSVATGLPSPVEITNARDGSGRLFIALQNGVIRILRNGALLPAPFLNISTRTQSTGECGLLGLAFPPGFANKQYFYVAYTNPGCTLSTVARYRVQAGNPDAADPASETVILTQAQPYTNHNGGHLEFGPDGYLYIGFGDGGSSGDPQNRAQNPGVLLGKILRIDTESGANPYAVPPTNPFVGNGIYRPEIHSLGLRNPWKFTFDRVTGGLWIADVGQDKNEEIDFAPAGTSGQNYGWNQMEGFDCYPPGSVCNPAGFTAPVFHYNHDAGDHSITGGYVYRGSRNPGLVGTYVYADLISGRVWGLRPNGPAWANRLLAASGLGFSSFGEDEAGEIYGAAYSRAEIFRIDPRPPTAASTIVSPSNGQTVAVSAVTFQWNAVNGATGWLLTVSQTAGGARVFEGVLAGANVLSTVINLPDGAYMFAIRGCNGGFGDANCGPAATVPFAVNLTKPAAAPSITQPASGAAFSVSTLQFSWSSVAGASRYEIDLTDPSSGTAELSTANYGNPPATSTIASVRSSPNYQLRVRACAAGCGPWSGTVGFSVTLPPVPSSPPAPPVCTLQNGQTASCSWNPVAGADLYVLQAIQPGAGPGGGALSVASRRVSTTSTTLTVPPGFASFIVAACNGNGCSPYSGAATLTPSGPPPAAPILATPVPGPVDGPTVNFSWTRIPGDNGSNTVYRLYVQDFLRAAPALDVLTTQNYWAAKFRAGGSRYDALVIANPGSANPAQGPASGFVVRGASPASPTMAVPRHQTPGIALHVPPGNVTLGWTPVPGAALYEYLVALAGQSEPVSRGVAPELQVRIPLAASGSLYSGIVRACPAGATCTFGSDSGWGPWSGSAGQTGVTSFLVGP